MKRASRVMKPSKIRCTALEKDTRPLDSIAALVAVWKAPQCERPATWKTPFGPRCDDHTAELETAMQSGHTLFHVLREGFFPELKEVRELPKTRIQ